MSSSLPDAAGAAGWGDAWRPRALEALCPSSPLLREEKDGRGDRLCLLVWGRGLHKDRTENALPMFLLFLYSPISVDEEPEACGGLVIRPKPRIESFYFIYLPKKDSFIYFSITKLKYLNCPPPCFFWKVETLLL